MMAITVQKTANLPLCLNSKIIKEPILKWYIAGFCSHLLSCLTGMKSDAIKYTSELTGMVGL